MNRTRMSWAVRRVLVTTIVMGACAWPAGSALAQSVTIAPPSWDAGVVAAGTTATRTFAVSNAGPAAVTIDSVAFGADTSGAFAIIGAPATPVTLAPGSSVTVTTTFAPVAGGAATGRLEVVAAGGGTTALVSGIGRLGGLDLPAAALDFPSIAVGSSATLATVLTNNGPAPVGINAATTPAGSPFAVAASTAPAVLMPGEAFTLTLRFSPTLAGAVEGVAEILTAVGPLTLLLDGTGTGADVAVSLDSLDFGNTLTGDSKTLDLMLTNPGPGSLQVDSLALRAGGSPAFSLPSPPPTPQALAPGDQMDVSVRFAPTEVAIAAGALDVRTNGAPAATLSVPLTAQGVARGYRIHPTEVDFGVVTPGSPLTRSVEIANAGTAALTLTSLGLAPGGSTGFTLVSPPVLPLTLAAGATRIVQVRFTATQPTDASGELLVTTSSGPASVALAAHGAYALALGGTSVRVGAGLQCAGCLTLSLAGGVTAPAGGLAVTVSSADPTRLLVAPSPIPVAGGSASMVVTIPGGATSVGFGVQGIEGAAGTVGLSAAAPNVIGAAATLSVVAPAVVLASLASPQTGAAADSVFYVRIGVLRTDGVTLDTVQTVRRGGPGALTATVTSSNAAAGLPVTSAGAAASRTVSIPVAALQTVSTVSGGGIAFRPLPAGGTTTVSATIPGFVAGPTATQSVAVTSATPSLTVSLGTLSRLGAGLEASGCCTVTSGVPAPAGGLAVTLASSDASRLLVAPSPVPASGGSGTTTVTIAASATSATFSLQGADGGSGTATVTASASGSTPSTSGAVSVETPVLTLVNLTASQTPAGANNDFQVRVGVPSTAGGTTFGTAQAVRTGGAAVTATVTTTNVAAGALVTSAGSDTTRTVTIAAGRSDSAATVATGGIAFDPNDAATGPETTTVSATIPGFTGTTGASQAVTLGLPALTVSLGTLARLGAGLEVFGCCTITLGAPAPASGLTVTLTSGDPSRLLVAPSPIPPSGGAPSITLAVPSGGTIVAFGLQGVAGTSGPATVTASASGYTAGTSGPVSVETPVVTLINVVPTQTATGVNNEFRVRTGLPATPGGTTFGTAQAVRQGGGAVTATVTATNATAGSLVTGTGSGTTQTVAIAPGQSDSPATVAAGGIAFDPNNALTATQTTTLAASSPGFTGAGASQAITINASATYRLILNGNITRIGIALQCSGCYAVALASGVAPAGGLDVTITSTDPSRLLVGPYPLRDFNSGTGGVPSTVVTIPAGGTGVSFGVQSPETATPGPASVIATAVGADPVTKDYTIERGVYTLVSLASPQTAGGPDVAFQIELGIRNPATGEVDTSGRTTRARWGGPGVHGTVTSSNAAAALLVAGSAAAASGPAFVDIYQFLSYDIKFRPQAQGGTTTVSAVVPGFDPAVGATQTIVVNGSAPNLSLNLGPLARLGAGLETAACCAVTSSLPATSDVTVTLTSSNPARLLVAPAVMPAGGGAAATTVTIPAGATSTAFSLQGVEGASGTASVSATATGYNAGASTTVSVERPVVTLIDLPSTLTATSTNDAFQVRVGLPATAGGITFGTAQAVRRGGPGATATVTTTNAAAGALVTSAGSGTSATVAIAPGQSDSPAAAAGGGVEFDPNDAATGTQTTTVAAAIAGFTASATASVPVTVVSASALTVSLGGLTRLGAGLEVAACCTVTSNAAAPATGLTVTLTSSNGGRLLVAQAPVPAGGGAGAITVTIPAGATSAGFSLQGVEGASGPATVTASSPGFTSDTSAAVTVESPAVTLVNLPSTLAATAPNAEFQVRVGLPTATGATTFGAAQAVRRGGPGVSATVTTSNAGAGGLAVSGSIGGSQSVAIAPGVSDSPATVAAGGIAFDPNDAATTTQTTTVSAAIAAYLASTGAAQTVRVTGSTLTMQFRTYGYGSGTFRLGAGLEAPYAGEVVLSGPAPAGGLAVTIRSDDPTVVLVESPSGWPPAGVASMTLTIGAGGTTTGLFSFQALETTIGRTTTLTATAPGLAPATSNTILSVQPVVQLTQVPATLGASAADTFFRVFIGATNEGGGRVTNGQYIRFGSPVASVSFTVSSSDPAVAQLVTADGRGATMTLAVPPGHFATPTVYVTGAERGIALDPLAGGTTTLSVSGPGYLTYPGFATIGVTVTP